MRSYGELFKEGDTITVHLDMDQGTLSFDRTHASACTFGQTSKIDRNVCQIVLSLSRVGVCGDSKRDKRALQRVKGLERLYDVQRSFEVLSSEDHHSSLQVYRIYVPETR